MGRQARLRAERAMVPATPAVAAATRPAAPTVDPDAINYLNAGLMVMSLLLALWLPFRLFLFVYAVLGPLHYFTEISWLHDRDYFTKPTGPRRAWLAIVMVGLAVLAWGLVDNGADRLFAPRWQVSVVYITFLSAVTAAVVRSLWLTIGITAAALAIVPAIGDNAAYLMGPALLLTIVHVLVFTALFVLAGALKTKSRSGFVSLAVMAGCVAALLLLPAAAQADASETVRQTYRSFQEVNAYLMRLLGFGRPHDVDAIYASAAGVIVMRLLAFSYTYHYLNWFSKTRVIKWHEISRPRAGAIALLWIASVGLYLWNYGIGLRVLYVVSVMHVLLEFPLDQITFVDIVKRLRPAAAHS
jgi:hypothetical protein